MKHEHEDGGEGQEPGAHEHGSSKLELGFSLMGIAMGAGGSDVALETADVALMADDLSKLPFAVGLPGEPPYYSSEPLGKFRHGGVSDSCHPNRLRWDWVGGCPARGLDTDRGYQRAAAFSLQRIDFKKPRPRGFKTSFAIHLHSYPERHQTLAMKVFSNEVTKNVRSSPHPIP